MPPPASTESNRLPFEDRLRRTAWESECCTCALAGKPLDAARTRDLEHPAITDDARGVPDHGPDVGSRSPDLPALAAAAEVGKPAIRRELWQLEGTEDRDCWRGRAEERLTVSGVAEGPPWMPPDPGVVRD